MPHDTFLNLSQDKRSRIESILLETFYHQPLSQVKVSDIVDKMGMSRGAFYKYFIDLEDANNHMISVSARQVHIDIMKQIKVAEDDLFFGISQFLLEMIQTPPQDSRRMALTFLTKSDHRMLSQRRKFPEQSSMLDSWFDILAQNQFAIQDKAEAVSFLYYIMALVIQSWNDYVANDWNSDQLMSDFQYKVKWLKDGIRHK